jgi:hypothetical protein
MSTGAKAFTFTVSDTVSSNVASEGTTGTKQAKAAITASSSKVASAGMIGVRVTIADLLNEEGEGVSMRSLPAKTTLAKSERTAARVIIVAFIFFFFDVDEAKLHPPEGPG